MRLRKNCQGNIVFRQPSAEVCQEFILLPNSRRGITLATEQCREPIKMGGQSTQIEIIGRHRRAVVQISHRSSPHRVGKSTLRDDSRIMPSPQRLTVTQTFVIVRELRQHSSATRNNPGLGIMTQIVQPHALDPGGFPDFRPLANLRPRVAGAVPEQQIGRIRPRQFFEFGDRLGAQRDDVALAAFAVFGRLRPAAADQVELALPRADKLTPPAPEQQQQLDRNGTAHVRPRSEHGDQSADLFERQIPLALVLAVPRDADARVVDAPSAS